MTKNVLIIVISLIFLGCSATTDHIKEEHFEFSPVLRSGEAITIISDKEIMFRGCLSDAIEKKKLNLRMISSREFREKVLCGMSKEELNQGLEP